MDLTQYCSKSVQAVGHPNDVVSILLTFCEGRAKNKTNGRLKKKKKTGKPVKMTKHQNIYSQRIYYRIIGNKMYSKHLQDGQKSITLPQNQPISFRPQVISHSALPYLDDAVIFTMAYNSFLLLQQKWRGGKKKKNITLNKQNPLKMFWVSRVANGGWIKV